MTQHSPVAQHGDSVSTTTGQKEQFSQERFLGSTQSFFKETFTIVGLEARKISHDPTDILTRAVQPVWAGIF